MPWLFLWKGLRSSSCPMFIFYFFIVVVVVCFVKGLNGQHVMHEMDLYGTSQDLSRQFVK